MSEHADIVIIGAGPGGYATALRAAQLGKSVVLVERDATLGGTCLNRGCIPSKALLTATRTIGMVGRAQQLGINATLNGVDYGALRDYRLRVVDTMTRGLAGLLAHRKVTVIHGQAELTDHTTVTITPSAGKQQVQRFRNAAVPEDAGQTLVINADHVVLATGSEPKPLPGQPFGGALIDSTQALARNQFPSSAVIIGAGAIAIEFASMWHAAGTDVTMLIRKDRLLSAWDRRTSMALTRDLKRHGITIIDHTSVSHVDTGVNLGATVHYTRGDDATDHTAYGEVVLAAIGRTPNTASPWFEKNSIALTDGGFVVTDAYGRTNVPGIWAVGDITVGPALAYRAYEQGIVIAESIAGLNPQPIDDDAVPQIVFSTPEVASVGMTLDEAQKRDDVLEVKETIYPMLSNARMLMSGSAGSMSVVSGMRASDPDTEVILGVHMMAPVASDLIAEAQQLVGNHVPLSQAARLIHPHPTFSETLGEAMLKADGRPLHTR